MVTKNNKLFKHIKVFNKICFHCFVDYSIIFMGDTNMKAKL